MIWVELEQVISLHGLLLSENGGLPGIRDNALLEAALGAPLASFAGQPLYPTIIERAARLGFGLVKNHPFNDGNKRIGVMSMLTVLEMNGYRVTASNDDVIALGLGLADGTYSYDDALDWVRKNSKPPLSAP